MDKFQGQGEAEFRIQAEEFLAKAIVLEAEIVQAGQSIRDASKELYQELLGARLMLVAVLAELVTFRAGLPGHTTEHASERLSLFVAFIQGVAITEVVISEGQYIKAAALMKQDIEILARIREVSSGTAKYGVTPNIKYTSEPMRRFYREMNNVSHVAKLDYLHDLLASTIEGEMRGVTPVPILHRRAALNLYSFHVILLLEMAREGIILFGEMYGNEVVSTLCLRMWQTAAEKLKARGWLVKQT